MSNKFRPDQVVQESVVVRRWRPYAEDAGDCHGVPALRLVHDSLLPIVRQRTGRPGSWPRPRTLALALIFLAADVTAPVAPGDANTVVTETLYKSS